MPDEVLEQTVDVEAPQTVEVQPEQTLEAVPGQGQEAVVADVEAEPQPVAFTFNSEDEVRRLAEQNEALARVIRQERDNGFNAGKQNRDAELRREQGANDRAQQYHAWLVSELEKGTDPKELARQTPMWVTANEQNALSRVSKALLQRAGELGDETARELAESLEGNHEELPRVAQATLDALVKRARNEAIETISLDTLPPSLKTQVDRLVAEQVEAKLAAELAATALEQQIAERPTPPDVMGSAPGSAGPVNPSTLPIDQYGAMSPAERQAMWAAWQEHQSRVA